MVTGNRGVTLIRTGYIKLETRGKVFVVLCPLQGGERAMLYWASCGTNWWSLAFTSHLEVHLE